MVGVGRALDILSVIRVIFAALSATLAGCAAGGIAADDVVPARPEAPAVAEGASRFGATLAGVTVSAWASGVVEVFVNGAPVGRAASAGGVVTVPASMLAGGENAVVLRATAGTASAPALLGEVQGAFGRAGTTSRWKVKPASATEATDVTGAWAQAAYDDASWSTATELATTRPPAFPSGGPARGIWDAAKSATLLARLKLYVPSGLEVDAPQGFGRGVTGGAGGAVVRPTTLAELERALCGSASGSTCTDSTPRIVEISTEFDFVGSEGKKTATGCYGYTICADASRSELLLDGTGQCRGKTKFDVTYDAAATNPLLVGSNKTLLGVGTGAVLRGKGLVLRGGVTNVVIRNVTITDLNPQIVWGGDAITIDDASRVWIDHDRISLIGRQMLVTHYAGATDVTISWNEFDGRTPYAPSCDGAHYWVWLLLGKGDRITMLGNWVHHTSGRGPHIGGTAGASSILHLLDTAYEGVTGHAVNPSSTDSSPQSRVLAEANSFSGVKTPVLLDAASPGLIYAPASDDAACEATLGRRCLGNAATPAPPSGWPPPRDSAALSGVASAYAGGAPAAFPAAEVPNVVPHLAGIGHLGAFTAATDFSLAATPASVTVKQGAAATTTIAIAQTSGASIAVALTASGQPAGVAATFSPPTSAGSSTLTLSSSSSAAPGTYTVTITGVAAGLSRTTSLTLTISASGAGSSGGGGSSGSGSSSGPNASSSSSGANGSSSSSGAGASSSSSGGAAQGASCASAGAVTNGLLGVLATALALVRRGRRHRRSTSVSRLSAP